MSMIFYPHKSIQKWGDVDTIYNRTIHFRRGSKITDAGKKTLYCRYYIHLQLFTMVVNVNKWKRGFIYHRLLGMQAT